MAAFIAFAPSPALARTSFSSPFRSACTAACDRRDSAERERACALVALRAGPAAPLSRRAFLVLTALSAAAVAPLQGTYDARALAVDAPFKLPPLPYAYDALQPHISEAIMRAHHDAHFATYVSKLNVALSDLKDRSIVNDDDLKRLLSRLQDVNDVAVRTQLRNNGGGYLNHKHFFACMTPGGAPLPPQSALSKRIQVQFGSFQAFETLFLDAAKSLFGSGFVWLVRDGDQLRIVKYANQDNPALDATVAVLPCDCWEHAWYYQYGPKKADYFREWWKVIDWPTVCRYYEGKV